MGGVDAARSSVHDRFIGSFAAGSQVVDRVGASEAWVTEHEAELRQQHDPQGKGLFVVRKNGNDIQLWWTPGIEERVRLDAEYELRSKQLELERQRYHEQIAEQQRLQEIRRAELLAQRELDAKIRAEELARDEERRRIARRALYLRWTRPSKFKVWFMAWLAGATPFQVYRQMRRHNGE